ncbi:zona pellucida sperm-binding protein 4-like isoform X3 [Oreochromis aureus]|uniref:zona pellucida sperm-binding protein 4-like isoform X3 n=1 Tax=Oreochromis aureus TaxID=47969 RepID=UPI0019533C67|nr:zona pellucida sperm-binding protein 4-like isoform X3 [Oreochromis aureus]
MAKFWSAKFFMALALLGSLAGTEVEAQNVPPFQPPPWQKPQDPQVLPYRPPPWKKPQDPQFPPILLPPLPKPQNPQPPPNQNPPPYRPPPPQNPQNPPPWQIPKKEPPPPPYIPPPPQNPQNPPPYRPPPPQIPQQPRPPPPQNPQPRPPPRPLPPGQQVPPFPQVSNDYFPQKPKVPQIPKVPPTLPPAQSCDVEKSVRVPCGTTGISGAHCESIKCCFDGNQCYFGKAVTVQCTRDAQFIVVVAKDITLPHLDLQTTSLAAGGPGCSYVDSNSAFAIYQFPVTACGTTFMEEPGVIIYENRMTSSYQVGVGPRGSITRDSHFDFLFQCRYIGTDVETVIVEILPLQNLPLPVSAMGPINVVMRLANGRCLTKGCNELDVAYTSFYTEADYPVTKVLRDPVYVEVQLLKKTDPMLVLTLGRCWVTTSPFPHTFPQWDILIDGCPYRDDNYLSSLVPVSANSGLDFPSHYRRFVFKMFTFVGSSVKDQKGMDPLHEKLYIHCSTAVCVSGQFVSCEPACHRTRRDVEAEDQTTNEPKTVVSSGPLIMTAPEQLTA